MRRDRRHFATELRLFLGAEDAAGAENGETDVVEEHLLQNALRILAVRDECGIVRDLVRVERAALIGPGAAEQDVVHAGPYGKRRQPPSEILTDRGLIGFDV